jgi:hypothetical protein
MEKWDGHGAILLSIPMFQFSTILTMQGRPNRKFYPKCHLNFQKSRKI